MRQLPDFPDLDLQEFDPDDAPGVLTGVSEACDHGECAECPGFGDHEGKQIFCVHECHRVNDPDVLNRKEVAPEEAAGRRMTAEEAMSEIWAELSCDCGPEDYAAMVEDIRKMNHYLHRIAPVTPGALPIWLRDRE